MGTTFSSTQSLSGSNSQGRASSSKTRRSSHKSTASSSIPTSPAGRKRKRQEISHDTTSSPTTSTTTTSPSKTKKPRTESQLSRFNFSSAWNSFADSFTCCFARIFLHAAELACKKASPGELEQEDDLINGVCQSLGCFQTTDQEILRRGWRILCACSRACTTESIALLFDQTPNTKSDLSAVLTAMERHPETIKIQLLGFRAIRHLVSECDDRWEMLADVQAVPVLLQAMRNHPFDLVVQGLGITFLAMLARDSLGQPQEQVINMGGIHVIVRAIQNFPGESRLLHTAFFALHQLGFSRRVTEIIGALDGRELFVKVLEDHMGDTGVVDVCLAALGKLGDDTEGVVSVLPVVLEAMKKWPQSSTTQGHGLAIMTRGVGHLPLHSVEAAIQHRLMVNDVIRHVALVMKNHPSKATLQFFACAVMREILERIPTPTIRKKLLDEGVIECVVRALQNHRDTYGLQPMGLLVLLNVFEHRTPEEVPATTAFGGSQRAIAAISGMMLEFIGDQQDDN